MRTRDHAELHVGGRWHADGHHRSATLRGEVVDGTVRWSVTLRRDEIELGTAAASSSAHARALFTAWIRHACRPDALEAPTS